MRRQKQVWEEEHSNEASLPSMANQTPASGVVEFVEYLKQRAKLNSGRAVDIGAGKGRHSVYLAEQGFEVVGMEYIQSAINAATKLAETKDVTSKVSFKNCEIDAVWPFEDNYFDVAIDSFSSIDIETREGREMYRDEIYRTLKPGGYAYVGVCSVEDEWEAELIKSSPGPEPNSTIWPNGKFQKNYDEAELRTFYSKFNILELKLVKRATNKLGNEGIASNFWTVLAKQ